MMLVLAFVLAACGKDDVADAEDDNLSFQPEWEAVYIGRYTDTDANGNPVSRDRIYSVGTDSAYYYHVIARKGDIRTKSELKKMFLDGSGVDDVSGRNGVLKWFSILSSTYDNASLSWILARGGADSEIGYLDYTILSDPNIGEFDVYTVEMSLDGELSGRYGHTVLDISGMPDIKTPEMISGMGIN